MTYDGRGNVTQVKQVAKTGSGLADIITSATYPATCSNPSSCNQPSTTTDARGKVTNYIYNVSGGVENIKLPAPTQGAHRPEVRYNYIQASTPGGSVSKVRNMSQCQTQASCNFTADEVKTTYGWTNQLALASVTQANGTGTLSAVTTITNDNIGDPFAIDGPLAGTDDTWRMRYDLMRRPVAPFHPIPMGRAPSSGGR